MNKSASPPECPVARSLAEIGERWSLLILRDAFAGLTRFDEFRRSLDAPTNILTTRLASLVEHGLLQRRRYCERPPRDEYVLTDKGRDTFSVLAALLAWGNQWLAPEGAAMLLADAETGCVIEPMVTDARTGRPVSPGTTALAAGPAAGPEVRGRVKQARTGFSKSKI